MKNWDVFISHATEDKTNLVEPLAKTLERLGVNVWYDGFSLGVGDLLSETINRGLENSIFGLLVISPDFLAKRWPKYEADYLLKREKEAETMILTLWHNVEYEQVRTWSLELADRVPIRTRSRNLTDTALQLIRIVKPDVLTNVHKRVASLRQSASAETKKVPVKDLLPAPIQHTDLPDELLMRIRLIRATLLSVYPHSFDFWVDGFRRDSFPSKSVSRWEHICVIYQEYISTVPLSPEQQEAAFWAIFSINSGQSLTTKAAHLLPEGAVDFLSRKFPYSSPLFDWKDEPFGFGSQGPELGEADEVMKTYFASKDKEQFPHDLPDDMMKELAKQERRKSRRAKAPRSKS
jgi:hypothetical protein